MNAEDQTLRYPIGKFKKPTEITESLFTDWLNELETLPTAVERLVIPFGLSDAV